MNQKLKMRRIANLLSILSTLIELGGGVLTKKPLTTEALVGQKTYFNCTSSIRDPKKLEIQWFHYPVQEKPQRQLVYGYGKISEPNYSGFQMEMDNATGVFNLVIPSVTSENAGNYECQEEFGRGEKSNAQLIVLESLPVCASATDLTKVMGANDCGIKSDQLLLSCIVQYKGNEPPVMTWRKSGDEQTTIDSHIAPTKVNNNKIIYNITMDGTSVATGSIFECSATRTPAETKCHTATVNVISKLSLPCSCNYAGAIFIFIFVVFLIGIAIAAFLHFWYFRKLKEKERENSEILNTMDQVFSVNFIPFFVGAAWGLYRYLSYLRPQIKRDQADHSKDSAALLTKQVKDEPNTRNEDVVVATTPVKRNPEGQENPHVKKITELEEERKKQLTEIKELKKTIQQLEEDLYPSDNVMNYVNKPSPVHKINTEMGTTENHPIAGLAVLGNHLFVSHENTSVIEVYDSATYVPQNQVTIHETENPLDIASCVKLSCLFVIGRLKSSKESISHILKIKPNGKVVAEWESGGNSGRLSTHETNVIVCLPDKLLVREFTGEGDKIRDIRLSPAYGFHNLSHAIKVTSMHFVVSHGEKDDELRRVCVINQDGSIRKKCEYWEKTKAPVCVLNDKGRSILVGDKEGRVILLNSNLLFQRKLIEKADNCVASRISFDETEKRLFVARNKVTSKTKEGQVLVFNVK